MRPPNIWPPFESWADEYQSFNGEATVGSGANSSNSRPHQPYCVVRVMREHDAKKRVNPFSFLKTAEDESIAWDTRKAEILLRSYQYAEAVRCMAIGVSDPDHMSVVQPYHSNSVCILRSPLETYPSTRRTLNGTLAPLWPSTLGRGSMHQ